MMISAMVSSCGLRLGFLVVDVWFWRRTSGQMFVIFAYFWERREFWTLTFLLFLFYRMENLLNLRGANYRKTNVK
jgi:hypothetical protein